MAASVNVMAIFSLHSFILTHHSIIVDGSPFMHRVKHRNPEIKDETLMVEKFEMK